MQPAPSPSHAPHLHTASENAEGIPPLFSDRPLQPRRQHRSQNAQTDIPRHRQHEAVQHHRPDADRRPQVEIIDDVHIHHPEKIHHQEPRQICKKSLSEREVPASL